MCRDLFFLLICLFGNYLNILSAATFNVTNTLDGGAGSFRWAITNANTTPGSNVIAFKISGSGPFTLNVSNALPIITNVVFIDGTAETNFNASTAAPIVELNGARAGGNVIGLDIQSSNCTVRGLAINRFSDDAIFIEGMGGNVVQGNFIGTGIYGTNALANGTNGAGGIQINCPNNIIGGVYASNRNLISGNTSYGINVNGAAAVGNIIQGNLIGSDITGNNRIANSTNGIMFSFGAAGNTVGGAVTGAGNLISGNGQCGIYVLSGNGNVIQGNFIGVNRAGTAALFNTYHGIAILGGSTSDPNFSKNTLIGGTNTASRNVISGNGTNGIAVTGSLKSTGTVIQGNYIGVSSNGLAKIPNGLNGITFLNASSNTIGGSIAGAGNLISGNAYQGIYIGDTYAKRNLIQNNLIGVDATGTNALGNGQMGVWLTGYTNVSGNTIGPGNIISGNGQEGVRIDSGAKANLVQGNFIGTDSTGQRSVGNAQNGVRIQSSGNNIGGLTTAARNIISGNTNYGIYLFDSSASNTLVQGNFIGTDSTGTALLGNAYGGVGIVGAPANNIGGTSAEGRNLISGNPKSAISIISNAASGNLIQGNYIGTDLTGMTALPNGWFQSTNDPGSYGEGIDISGAPFTIIGGSTYGAGNVISGNKLDAICIGDPGASNSLIQGNLVGVKADGVTPLGNDWNGVEIRNTGGGNNTVIGGNQPGAGNIFANAVSLYQSGVRIKSGVGNTGILVRGNSIYNNGGSGGFGIYLGPFTYAITPNDSCDATKSFTTNANLLQNYPVLAKAYSDGKNTTVTGTLNSTANSSFLLQFYNNAVITGNVQGQYFLGDLTAATGANCASNYSFTARFTNAVPVGQVITATATDAGNNTSEFSLGVPVLPPPPLFGTNSFAGGNPQLKLSWPTNGAVFALVQTTNLTPPIVWSPLNNLPVMVGTNYVITLISTNDQRYYRLSF